MFRTVILLASILVIASAQNPRCTSGSGSLAVANYAVDWTLQSNGLFVEFNVTVNTASNTWGALGLSLNQVMASTDVVVAGNDGTNEFVEDRWNGDGRNGLLLDTRQNIMDTSSDRDGDTLMFSFTRGVCSRDNTQDIDLVGPNGNRTCSYILYAYGGSVGTFPSDSTTYAQGLTGHNRASRGVFATQLCLTCEADFRCSATHIGVSAVVILFAVVVALADLI